MGKAQVELARVATDGGKCVECRILVHDPELIGREAILSIHQEAKVKRGDPVHGRRELFRKSLRLSEGTTSLRLDPEALPVYSYSGKTIDLVLHTTLTVDDGILFDTKLASCHELEIDGKGDGASDTSVVDPKDHFQFLTNLAMIPFSSQIVTLVLALVGAVVIFVNTLVGVHDQLAPEPAVYFYSHRDSDGDSTSPFVNSLAGSGAIGAGMWALMRKQLRKYMRFHFGRLPEKITRGTSLAVGTLIAGRSRVPLENATLQIVACNFELGQCRRRSGRRTKTVSFREPVRPVVLFRKTVPRIPAHQPISRFFPDVVSFDPMFETLLPPQRVTKRHGIEIHWEVQLLHDQLVDQELVGPTEGFRYQDFLSG